MNNLEICENLKKFNFVEDAIVLGIPHPIFGSIPKAFVVLKKKGNISYADSNSPYATGYGEDKTTQLIASKSKLLEIPSNSIELQNQNQNGNGGQYQYQNEELKNFEFEIGEFENEKNDKILNSITLEFERQNVNYFSEEAENMKNGISTTISNWKNGKKKKNSELESKIEAFLSEFVKRNCNSNMQIEILDKFPIIKSKITNGNKFAPIQVQKKIDKKALIPKKKEKNGTFIGALFNSIYNSIGN